ncbi:Protein DMSR-6, partial [Aphelenchoides avenae]
MECGQLENLFSLTDDSSIVTILDVVAVIYYAAVHQSFALVLCLLGVATNVLHIAVLSPFEMRRNAVNRLLIFIAVCDIATVCLYSVFVFQFGSPGALTEPPVGFEFWWTVFLLVYSVLSVALHSITVYCVVAAACLRYWSVRTLTNKWRHLNISRTVSSMCLMIAGLCVPAICLHSIERVSLPTETASALYRINLSGVGPLRACSLFKINLWLSGFFFK